jgi:hypothetical protein
LRPFKKSLSRARVSLSDHKKGEQHSTANNPDSSRMHVIKRDGRYAVHH